jgi:hypothetical protein
MDLEPPLYIYRCRLRAASSTNFRNSKSGELWRFQAQNSLEESFTTHFKVTESNVIEIMKSSIEKQAS